MDGGAAVKRGCVTIRIHDAFDFPCPGGASFWRTRNQVDRLLWSGNEH